MSWADEIITNKTKEEKILYFQSQSEKYQWNCIDLNELERYQEEVVLAITNFEVWEKFTFGRYVKNDQVVEHIIKHLEEFKMVKCFDSNDVVKNPNIVKYFIERYGRFSFCSVDFITKESYELTKDTYTERKVGEILGYTRRAPEANPEKFASINEVIEFLKKRFSGEYFIKSAISDLENSYFYDYLYDNEKLEPKLKRIFGMDFNVVDDILMWNIEVFKRLFSRFVDFKDDNEFYEQFRACILADTSKDSDYESPEKIEYLTRMLDKLLKVEMAKHLDAVLIKNCDNKKSTKLKI